MKNITLKIVFICLFFSISAYAYEASDVNIKWTGFKTELKKGVPGTFDKINLDINSNDDFKKFLQSAKVYIDTESLNSNVKTRDNNIISTLFHLEGAKMIYVTVNKVNGDMSSGKLLLEIIMNKVSQVVSMDYKVKEQKVIANGTIDILDFSMNDSFKAFATKCSKLHAGKTWTQVDIYFELPFTK